jgi:hypothetical protein
MYVLIWADIRRRREQASGRCYDGQSGGTAIREPAPLLRHAEKMRLPIRAAKIARQLHAVRFQAQAFQRISSDAIQLVHGESPRILPTIDHVTPLINLSVVYNTDRANSR